MRIIKADLAGSALSTFCGQIFDLLYQQCDAACVSTQRKDESSHLLSSMLERTTGIEPASSAWEADILPMNYVRACICLASVLPTPAACPLKCHALKCCTFWRETCLASVFALRLVNQRARATSHCARTLYYCADNNSILFIRFRLKT